MHNVPATSTDDQAPALDTPRRSKAPTTGWVNACVDGIRTSTRRRLPGGWKRIGQGVDGKTGKDDGTLAHELHLLHGDGRPYSARHIRSGLLEAERHGYIEVRRARPEQREDGTWHRPELSCYRVVSAKRRRRRGTDGKQVSPTPLRCSHSSQTQGVRSWSYRLEVCEHGGESGLTRDGRPKCPICRGMIPLF